MYKVDNIKKSCFKCSNKALKTMMGCWECIDDNKNNPDRFSYISLEESDKIGCEFHSELKGSEGDI